MPGVAGSSGLAAVSQQPGVARHKPVPVQTIRGERALPVVKTHAMRAGIFKASGSIETKTCTDVGLEVLNK